MATTRFDRVRLVQEFEERARRKQQSIEVAHDLLLDYVVMAQELGVNPQVVDSKSQAAQIAGITLADLPKGTSNQYQYFPLITSSAFEFWLAAEARGLLLLPNGDTFLKGKSVSVADAAFWLASVSGFNPDRVQELLEDALRGSPAQV